MTRRPANGTLPLQLLGIVAVTALLGGAFLVVAAVLNVSYFTVLAGVAVVLVAWAVVRLAGRR